MGCLLGLFAGIFPRIALVAVWVFTNDVDRAYDTFVIPLLGLIFLPLTTLVYALLWSPIGGVEDFEWVWVGLAFLVDLAGVGGGARSRRD
jgi:hypothetical protein